MHYATLSDEELRRSVTVSALMAALIPPGVGALLMGVAGFYPMPEVYLIFFHYTGIYVLVALAAVLLGARSLTRAILEMPKMDPRLAELHARRFFRRLPWYLLGGIALYSSGGAITADLSIEAMGIREYTPRDHLNNQFGLIPVVLITVFPIFFFFVDQIGRYLGPRGIAITAIPLWIKVAMLGIVTPVLIDSLLIGYYYNKTGHLGVDTVGLWLSLIALAIGGTWYAWRSLHQSIAPLQAFALAGNEPFGDRVRNSLKPLSLDEFGPLTARIAQSLVAQEKLSTDLNRARGLADAAIDHAAALVVVLDQEQRIVRFNQAAEKLSGLRAADVVGKPPSQTYLWPDSSGPSRRATDRQALQGFEGQSRHRFESWKSSDGSQHLIEWFDAVLPDGSGPGQLLIGFGTDVTERIRMERELAEQRRNLQELIELRTGELAEATQMNAQILAASTVGIAVYRASGECVFANDAIARLVGTTPQRLLQMNFRSIPSWRNSGMLDLAEATLETGQSRRSEIQMTTSFGQQRWFDCSFARFVRGGEHHVIAQAVDATMYKQAEAELIGARDKAERASRAKSEFLSRMSHELRTPMNAILGFSQVLEMDHSLKPQQLQQVNEIRHAGDHLLKLIDELLDLSRIESGKLVTVVVPLALRPILKEALQIVQPMRQANQIVIREQCELQLELLADATRLRQVLVNLLSNAIKYNREGGEVQVSCQVVQSSWLRVEVSDSGPGISEENLARLFRPFERLGAEFGKVGGTGIGLALSRQLIELMGGSMGAESSPGKGSTFWFELPLAPASAARAGEAQPKPALPSTEDERFLVLYVEDNPANLRLLEAMFEFQPSLRLISATTGEYGLELARSSKPDVILLDIHLPGMDGYEVLAALQADPATSAIPVVALTADAMPLDIETGLKAGFRRYVTKPVNLIMLLGVLHELAGSRWIAPS